MLSFFLRNLWRTSDYAYLGISVGDRITMNQYFSQHGTLAPVSGRSSRVTDPVSPRSRRTPQNGVTPSRGRAAGSSNTARYSPQSENDFSRSPHSALRPGTAAEKKTPDKKKRPAEDSAGTSSGPVAPTSRRKRRE
jgi:hypothetical protein